MSSALLHRLASAEFEAEFVAGTPRVLHDMLCRSPEARELYRKNAQGLIPDESLRQFVNDLLREYASAEPFPRQTALAAISVVMEGRFTPFAEEYIQDLARVSSSRFMMASRVARICLASRAQRPRYESRTFVIEEPEPPRPEYRFIVDVRNNIVPAVDAEYSLTNFELANACT